MRFFEAPNINFIDMRRKAFVLSGLIILSSLGLLVVKGGPKYGIDFTGGTLIQIAMNEEISSGKIRSSLSKIGMATAELQNYGSKKDYLIKYYGGEEPDSVLAHLSTSLNQKMKLVRTEQVGPRIGKELQLKAIYAVLIGMLLMLVYITIRFNLPFGISAVIAILHDVLITLGFITLLNLEVDIPVIAALLTIVGYSINDSIIVSDRIRENVKKFRGQFTQIANQSINQTLSRTLITSGTTLLVLICLLILGGPILRNFSTTLVIGIMVGTYSSIFVVAALVAEWEDFKRKKGKRR